MSIEDDAVEVRTQGWRTLAALHASIEADLERALQASVDLSVVEYTVLDALSRQDGWHLRMQQLARHRPQPERDHPAGQPAGRARPAPPHPLPRRSARNLHRAHPAGQALLTDARPVHDTTLERALAKGHEVPELASRVEALPRLLSTPA
jgi:hypothetical protein